MKTIDDLIATYEAKQHDYGNSTHESVVRWGLISMVVRISDKINRWNTLSKNDAMVKSESLLDTIGDAFTYACMFIGETVAINYSIDVPDIPTIMRKISKLALADTLSSKAQVVMPPSGAKCVLTLIGEKVSYNSFTACEELCEKLAIDMAKLYNILSNEEQEGKLTK